MVSALFGITVARKSGSESSSAELVQDFLFYSGDLPIEKAAGIAGVSTATLGRWRMMGARQLRADVRSRLEEYLDTIQASRNGMRAA